MSIFDGAPREVIDAFIENMKKRIDFLERLWSEDHHFEALLLCCAYVEGLGRWWYGLQDEASDLRSKRAFCDILCDYGGSNLLSLVDPICLARELEALDHRKSPQNRKLSTSIEAIYAVYEPDSAPLVSVHELLEALRRRLNDRQLALVQEHAWRGTVAALSYQELRNPSVHHFLAPNGIVLRQPLEEGKLPRYQRVGFPELYAALGRIGKIIERHLVAQYSDEEEWEASTGGEEGAGRGLPPEDV